ncbi:unnamed protein product [Effrenium voratum]|nr:unnamed protein product [Effrenium voratum]
MARFGRFALLVALACGVGDAQCNGIKAGGSKMCGFVEEIYANERAFAARKSDGSVVTWGSKHHGGDSSTVASQIASGVENIYFNNYAFAARKGDGSVVTWGDSDYGGDSSSDIYAGPYVFAAKKSGGAVVTWGHPFYGGTSSAVASQLASGVEAGPVESG